MAELVQILFPRLTAADPGFSREGGLDPLGLYAIADSLGIRLVPGVRERMSDPRYLASVAVGMALWGDLPPDKLADAGKSEPWQVYEWYVVEGLVHTYGDGEEIRGLPGVEKGRAAVRNRLALSPASYLKSPSVFGFHGVYRGLGKELGLFDDVGLLPSGWDLVDAWEKDQGLDGFLKGKGSLSSRRDSLRRAVLEGLDAGCTKRGPGWAGWQFIGRHFGPHASGPRELEVLRQALAGEAGSPRRQVLVCLVSEAGQHVWHESEGSERAFHEVLYQQADAEVRRLLDAISAYERFARLVQDAFEDCLYHLSTAYGRQSSKDLSKLPGVRRAVELVPDAFDEAEQALSAVDLSGRFVETFGSLGERSNAATWTDILLDHHFRNQARKPPNGRNPWFDRFDDGSVAVRAGYRREEGGRGDNEYVHFYRTRPLDSFARRLGFVDS